MILAGPVVLVVVFFCFYSLYENIFHPPLFLFV